MRRETQSGSAKHPIVRRGYLELYKSDGTHPVPSTGNLEYIGRTDGYGMDLSFVMDDPYVREALIEMYGEVPDELKGYTRSGATLERMYAGLMRYDRDRTRVPKGDAHFQRAVEVVSKAFRLPKPLKPLKVDEVPYQPDTSAGWTFLGMKKREVVDSAMDEAEKLERLANNGRLNVAALPPCVAYKRTQLAKVMEPKVRLVWGYPFEMTLLEGKFAAPLIDAYSQRESPMFIGKTILKELPIFMDGLFAGGKLGVALDWSGFDSSLDVSLINIAFDILEENLDLSRTRDRAAWRLIRKYFIDTAIVLPDGHAYLKHGGVPSGSYFTQLIDSLCNMIVILTMQMKCWDTKPWVTKHTRFFPYSRTKVLGDDSVFSVPRGQSVILAEWKVAAERMFGLQLNADKSVVTERLDDLEFLGHGSRNGRVYRPLVRLLRLALYPEQRVDDPGTSVSRVMGLLIDSGFQTWEIYLLYNRLVAQHGHVGPLKDKFVQYVIQQELPTGIPPDHRLYAVS